MAEAAASIPEEDLQNVPTDLSENLDKYVYQLSGAESDENALNG